MNLSCFKRNFTNASMYHSTPLADGDYKMCLREAQVCSYSSQKKTDYYGYVITRHNFQNSKPKIDFRIEFVQICQNQQDMTKKRHYCRLVLFS